MTTETVRLHISPLTPTLLPAVLGPTRTVLARNVSYGEIQTFPEHNYGFVDLPAVDAERLKKKLAGAIFKGVKMKVDDARPKKRRRTENSSENAEENEAQMISVPSAIAPKEKRKPAAGNVLAGHELSPERKVKRAWTGPQKEKKSKKKGATSQQQQQPSKYSENEELLFRTKVPLNKTDLLTKKGKKPKKSRHGAEESIVHEFEKTTTQPSFLKADHAEDRTNLTYEDGKGWLNDEGAVIEAEPLNLARRRMRGLHGSQEPKAVSLRRRAKPGSIDSNALGIAASKISEKPNRRKAPEAQRTIEQEEGQENGEYEDDDESSCEESQVHSPPALTAVDEQGGQREQAHQSTKSPDIHPLESLFKKPRKPTSQDVAKPSLEISTAFSFFDQDTDEDDAEAKMPLTPFTSQDLRNRGLRSAAPTPDTAYPSRFNSHDSVDTSEDGEVQQEEVIDSHINREKSLEQGGTSPSKTNDATVSEFEKLFWEKRGDNNRAWKARRRAVLKEKRHRENKARRPKNW